MGVETGRSSTEMGYFLQKNKFTAEKNIYPKNHFFTQKLKGQNMAEIAFDYVYWYEGPSEIFFNKTALKNM